MVMKSACSSSIWVSPGARNQWQDCHSIGGKSPSRGSHYRLACSNSLITQFQKWDKSLCLSGWQPPFQCIFVLHSLATQLLCSDMAISSPEWKWKEKGGEKKKERKKKLLFWQPRDLTAVEVWLAKFLNQLIWGIIELAGNKHRLHLSHVSVSHSVMSPHIGRAFSCLWRANQRTIL